MYLRVDTSADEIFVSDGIVSPVVSASALTWLIKYICLSNIHFLNHVIIIKIKVLHPQT
jgi:hypothetical protein